MPPPIHFLFRGFCHCRRPSSSCLFILWFSIKYAFPFIITSFIFSLLVPFSSSATSIFLLIFSGCLFKSLHLPLLISGSAAAHPTNRPADPAAIARPSPAMPCWRRPSIRAELWKSPPSLEPDRHCNRIQTNNQIDRNKKCSQF